MDCQQPDLWGIFPLSECELGQKEERRCHPTGSFARRNLIRYQNQPVKKTENHEPGTGAFHSKYIISHVPKQEEAVEPHAREVVVRRTSHPYSGSDCSALNMTPSNPKPLGCFHSIHSLIQMPGAVLAPIIVAGPNPK